MSADSSYSEDTSLAGGDPSTLRIGDKASNIKEHDVIDEEFQQADKIKDELETELAENDGWVLILGNNQLMKKVVKEGVSNTRPLRGEVCVVSLKGYLKDDESVVFESNDKFTFQLGDAEVISGLDLAVPLMCKGEISYISISPRFGYGAKGCSPNIPPNAWIIYKVELIDFNPERDLEQFSVSERREIGNRKRERGNWWYERGEAALAVQCYRRALEFLDEVEGGISLSKDTHDINDTIVSNELKLLFDDRLKTYNNMAAAQLKLQAYGPALKSVEAVLKCEPRNVKALFRKGRILAAKGDTDEALIVLKQAINLEPDNKAVINEIGKLSMKRNEEKQNEKLLYKRMFNTSKNKEKENEAKSGFKRSMNIALIAGGLFVAVAGVMAYRYVT